MLDGCRDSGSAGSPGGTNDALVVGLAWSG
jgi:hypothetical protein